MKRRVVITGLGAVSGLGVGIKPLWEGLIAGRSALKPIARFDPAGFPCRIAAEVGPPYFNGGKDFVPKSYRKAVKVMARDIELAVAAAKCAVEDAALVTRGTIPEDAAEPMATTYPGARMGCHIGAGLIAAEADELTMAMASSARGLTNQPDPAAPLPSLDLKAWGTITEVGGAGGMNNLPPLWMLKYLPNMLACHVTIIHGAEGPSNTITCAEASGLLSIGESVRIIERGDADLCFSGGAEAPVNLMRLLRMDLAGRLAATGEQTDGSQVVRPYDPASPGGLAGDGGGILILEERDAAARRSARIYAEVVGYGAAHSSPSAFHLGPAGLAADEPPAEVDDGLQYAIENALEDARLTPAEIDAIVPHASGIPEMDRAEAGALRAIFGERLGAIPLITLTPVIGDTLASSGGLAVAVAAMCLREQMLPARLHSGQPLPGLDAGPAPARAAALRHLLVATGSLGGQNAAIILRAEPPARP
jgi:3-oxoacyl-[acyl-carrier-protein] synthase II